jgi:L-threonylcarbamoyladenylate synthase
VDALRDGHVIAYPTESVWGLGCDPWNERAVTTLLYLKQRPVAKGLILIAANISQIEPFLVGLSSAQRETVVSTWTDPQAPATTWLVPLTADIPPWISGSHDRVALRVTRHLEAQALCTVFGRPLVSTSANPGGEPAAQTAESVIDYFHDQVLIVPGPTSGAQQPSVIRDAITGSVLRG